METKMTAASAMAASTNPRHRTDNGVARTTDPDKRRCVAWKMASRRNKSFMYSPLPASVQPVPS
jgi:hypothetical protein